MEITGRDKITITNSTLTNCFNTIEQMPEGPVKKEMEALTQLVEEFLAKAQAEPAAKAKESLEILLKEAAKPKPDRRWFDLSADGLKEAAASVAAMTPSIVAVIERLRGYLSL